MGRNSYFENLALGVANLPFLAFPSPFLKFFFWVFRSIVVIQLAFCESVTIVGSILIETWGFSPPPPPFPFEGEERKGEFEYSYSGVEIQSVAPPCERPMSFLPIKGPQ